MSYSDYDHLDSDATGTTQLSWIKDMMAHVKSDRMAKFSTPGHSGEDVSVFWEPESSPFADPCATRYDSDLLGHDTVTILSGFGSSPVLTASIPDNDDERSHAKSHTRHGGAAALGQLTRVINVQSEATQEKKCFVNAAFSVQPDKQEENQSTRVRAGGEVIIPVQATRTTGAHRARKRTISDVQVDSRDPDQEKESKNPAPAVKRICREKTGTDWQSVFDVIKYSEERQNSDRTNEGHGMKTGLS
ncbi:hypothetical protein CY34DRAFT_16383 [Suillus luteus UH-Slu-Lm8-n1]|uniref:Uncharacterized protein n=1 Tax=Suillus luteus UH-Slu-Lm8-n1 TaxID=930992 RepID=A0A0D0AX50_9AGAM|nr:hypothetical protein CY34DRAFT_16383 [Suillus luteus UH-Slu-Lm8-n1]